MVKRRFAIYVLLFFLIVPAIIWLGGTQARQRNDVALREFELCTLKRTNCVGAQPSPQKQGAIREAVLRKIADDQRALYPWRLAEAILTAVVAVAIYLIPTIVAAQRRHRQLPAIVGVNLLFGWTFVGWGIALVWALIRSRHSTKVAAEKFD